MIVAKIASSRCTAHNKRGGMCKSQAILGATVCRMHGGSAPQVKAKAAERLRLLVPNAVDALEQIVNDSEHPQRLAAAREILERDGKIGVLSTVAGDGGTVLQLVIMPSGQQLPPGARIRQIGSGAVRDEV